MANLSWDHTVHYVKNLDEAIEEFTSRGIYARRGGSHTTWGTYNALSYFGLCYIEFLAVENEELVRKQKHVNSVVFDAERLLPEKEIISRIAIRSDQIEETVHALKELGLNVTPIVEGSRTNSLGKKIEWKMASIEGDYDGVVYPFFIQWSQSDDKRLESLEEAGAIQSHPLGEIALKEVVIPCTNPHYVAEHWGNILGLKLAEKGKDYMKLQIQDQYFTFQQGRPDQSMKVIFKSSQTDVKGTGFKIGGGEYLFS